MFIKTVSLRFPVLALFLGCLMSGCELIPVQVPAAFNPVQGPLAAENPRPTYVGQFSVLSAQLEGPVAVQLANGETFTGSWQSIDPLSNPTVSPPGVASPPDLSADWDFVYGAGYFRAHVLGARYYARSFLTGSAGDTGTIELAREHLCGEMHGVARDSHQNVYKVSTFIDCASQSASVGFGVADSMGIGDAGSPAPGPDMHSTGPTLMIPATGGAPVMAIPLGGNVFLPVTGGSGPVPGIPIP